MKPTDKVFLAAEWRHLVMLNWEVEPDLVASSVPAGSELDFHEGKTYVSIVGFMFLNTRLLGLPIPFHRNFEELNLRFYVFRKEPDSDEVKRGVAFISELVPRWAIATVARVGYNENYRSVPMRHSIDHGDEMIRVEYGWKNQGRWNAVSAKGNGQPLPLQEGSLEQFIAEHYWGYAQQRNGSTFEYRVQHEPWNVWHGTDVQFDCEVASQYGSEFVETLAQPPDSTFIADGSAVTVSRPRRIINR